MSNCWTIKESFPNCSFALTQQCSCFPKVKILLSQDEYLSFWKLRAHPPWGHPPSSSDKQILPTPTLLLWSWRNLPHSHFKYLAHGIYIFLFGLMRVRPFIWIFKKQSLCYRLGFGNQYFDGSYSTWKCMKPPNCERRRELRDRESWCHLTCGLPVSEVKALLDSSR